MTVAKLNKILLDIITENGLRDEANKRIQSGNTAPVAKDAIDTAIASTKKKIKVGDYVAKVMDDNDPRTPEEIVGLVNEVLTEEKNVTRVTMQNINGYFSYHGVNAGYERSDDNGIVKWTLTAQTAAQALETAVSAKGAKKK
jgi:hypothetical protein